MSIELPSPLEIGWVTKKNKVGSHFYYYNAITGEVRQWSRRDGGEEEGAGGGRRG